MMNTVKEEEEKSPSEESEKLLNKQTSSPRLPADSIVDDHKNHGEHKPDHRSHSIPKIQETAATPTLPRHDRHERHEKLNERRPSAFETMFQVFRRPSTTLDAFSNLRRSSGSRRGSHANLDHSRRPSPDLGHSRSHGLLVPHHSNHHMDLRRPSVITFSPDQINAHQKRYIMGLLHASSSSLPELCKDVPNRKEVMTQCKEGYDALISTLSAFYAKILFVMGIAFPVTEVLAPNHVPTHFYQGFYLFLYLGSLGFMMSMYVALLKDRAVSKLIQSSFDVEDEDLHRIQSLRRNRPTDHTPVRYGSFYLRLGAVAFGIGSMVYSGLEFGQYFELSSDSSCSNVLQAVTPVARMILTLVQMQFIFLNSQQMEMSQHCIIARFGLMHLIATNLCEWLYVIVEETKHEIDHLQHLKNYSENIAEILKAHHHDKRGTKDLNFCRRANIMGSMVQDASPFLFPCTIEYSLICAVIMFEMWKKIGKANNYPETPKEKSFKRELSRSEPQKASHHFSVDCSNAHKGLFSGILLLVMTIISLIMFFVMKKDDDYEAIAIYQVNVCEIVMYSVTTLMILIGGWKLRFLKFQTQLRMRNGIGLDNTLLLWAQSGVLIYCMFSIISSYFVSDIMSPSLICDVFALIQATCQTVFILDGTFRRTETLLQYKNKPGRQIITFLLVANMALWLVFTLQKSRAEFSPSHLAFFGVWAWTVITHVSMPLAIFFRFHSTICLFEIWKDAYKFKPGH